MPYRVLSGYFDDPQGWRLIGGECRSFREAVAAREAALREGGGYAVLIVEVIDVLDAYARARDEPKPRVPRPSARKAQKA